MLISGAPKYRTRKAKQRALDRELLEHYIEYFGRAMQTRNWSP